MISADSAAHFAAVLAAQREEDQPFAQERAVLHQPRVRISGRWAQAVTDAPWMRQVLGRGEPHIGRTRTDIESVFFDHALIVSLGCESVLNMPVCWRVRTLGTLNLLHRAGQYEETDLPLARQFAALALPGLMTMSQSQ